MTSHPRATAETRLSPIIEETADAPRASPAKIRCGIVGFGKAGRTRHAALTASGEWDVKAIADPALGDGAAPEGVRALRDSQQLLDMELDAVFICTPNHVTADVVVAALSRGLHVFCEKPPGRNVEDVRRIVEAERKNPGSKLKFGFNHRYHDAVLEAKALIDSGALGNVLWMRGIYGKSGLDGSMNDWRAHRATAGGGILLDQGIHMLDLFRFFGFEAEQVKSYVGTNFWPVDIEDNAFALLRDAGGHVAFLHSSWTHWKHRFTLEVFLQRGYISIQGINTSSRSYGRETLSVARNHLGGDSFPVGNPREDVTYFDRDDSWRREVDEFADSIRKDRPVAMGTSDDAYRAMEMVARVYEADPDWAKLRGNPVPAAAPIPPVELAHRHPTSRRVVVRDDMREDQIRPRELYHDYLQLARAEALRFDRASFITVDCPACGEKDPTRSFERDGFEYAMCGRCATLFVPKRPNAKLLRAHHHDSKAARFWRERFFAETSAARRERVFRPRVDWLIELANGSGWTTPSMADLGSGYGILLEEVVRANVFGRVVALDPIRDVEQVSDGMGVDVVTRPSTELTRKDVAPDIITAFEVLERVFSIDDLVGTAARLLAPGGLFAFTTLTSDGFDVQVLWDKAPSIYPPDRLNLVSLEGVRALAARHGFEVLELSTPGQLDVEVVAQALRTDPTLPVPRFVRSLFDRGTPESFAQFQEFLQTNRMSSHLRAVLRRR